MPRATVRKCVRAGDAKNSVFAVRFDVRDGAKFLVGQLAGGLMTGPPVSS